MQLHSVMNDDVERLEARAASPQLLWDVFEEHVHEAEYCCGALGLALNSAQTVLTEIQTGVEERFLAHIDALLLGGEAVLQRLLLPAVAEIDPRDGERNTALAFVLALSGQLHRVLDAIDGEEPALHRALVRGLVWARPPKLEEWIEHRLQSDGSSAKRAALFEVAAGCGHLPRRSTQQALCGDDLRVAVAALRCAALGDPNEYQRSVENLLVHTDTEVRDAAMTTALHFGSPVAWRLCQVLATRPDRPNLRAMMLVAGLGDPADHGRLVERLALPTHRRAVIRALGLTGNVGLVPKLLTYVDCSDEMEARLAAEAIATIAGVTNAALQREGDDAQPKGASAEEALPAFDDDDMDADLVPAAEDELPLPDPARLVEWWAAQGSKFDPRIRYVGGEPATPVSMCRAMLNFPTRRHTALSTLVAIRTGAQVRPSVQAMASRRINELQTAMRTPARCFARAFGRW